MDSTFSLSVQKIEPAMDDFLRKDFWSELCPQLSITTKLNQPVKPMALDKPTFDRIQQRLVQEGYFSGSDTMLQQNMPALASTIKQFVSIDIPPPFLFLFDEPWECFYRLHPLFSRILGDGYRLLPDFWAWHVDPAKQQSGWTPHRDKGGHSLAKDGTPLSLTVWMPITEATSLNGCIYMIPANRDPSYNTPQENQWQINLPDIRALPAKPGEFLCWNQAVLHWGARSSAFAEEPRISMAFEFQRGDIKPYNLPLLPPLANLDFSSRLRLVGKQILQYKHMYPLSPKLEAVAQRMLSV